ncbi:hypothetical protein AB0I53_17310 [Saccharopolyspora sp. NPDC050389]|uniref:hypothetical protein n=1 Tax=Saccharopolyspora sp. NPDC050389 TaxID=3155516 RepID=UPI0034093C1F
MSADQPAETSSVESEVIALASTPFVAVRGDIDAMAALQEMYRNGVWKSDADPVNNNQQRLSWTALAKNSYLPAGAAVEHRVQLLGAPTATRHETTPRKTLTMAPPRRLPALTGFLWSASLVDGLDSGAQVGISPTELF